MIDDKWDIDEKANDTRTYETKEYSLEALNHIIKKYLLLKKNEDTILQNLWIINAVDLIRILCIMIKIFINLL